MQGRVRFPIVMLLLFISAPWLAAISPVQPEEESDLAVEFPELNEAQVDAILATGARGVTTWAKQGTAGPNAVNDGSNINSVWVSDVISTANGDVIISGSWRGDVLFDGGTTPPDRTQRSAFIAQLDQWGSWSWFRHSGQPADSVGGAHIESVSMGPAGVWVCGWLYDTITFGSHSLTTGGLYRDGFAAMYNVSQTNWDTAFSFGGPSHDVANGCAATSDGSVYVVGAHTGTAQFGGNSHQSEGGVDMFVLMGDSMGNIPWVKAWGSDQNDNLTGVVVDGSDFAYVVGHYRDNAQDWPNNHIMPAGRPTNAFVSKLNAGGAFQWSRAIAGGVNGDEAYATAVTYGNGDVYVGGYVYGSGEFRQGQTVILTLNTNFSANNGFVAAIGTNGAWVWATRAAGPSQSSQVVHDLSVGPLGTIAVAGSFADQNEFWTNATFGTHVLVRAPAVEGFVAGMDPNGNWIWADGLGGEKDDHALGVTWVGLGRVVAVGRHCVHLVFGCGSDFGTVNKSTYSYDDGAGFIWSFKVDTDFDSVADLDDNCPTISNAGQENMDGDTMGDVCDTDADGDSYDDWFDDCIGPAVNWNQTTWSLDRDGDGCRDSDEDDDDDGDGILDGSDQCDSAIQKHNWTSGLANDYDSDGCHDGDEDLDDDSDSVMDVDDACPRIPFNRTWISNPTNDHDGDGCDNTDDDADDDDDGIDDLDGDGEMLDECPRGTLGWTSNASNDMDGDGCIDDGEDYDDDGDGVQDFVDDCLNGKLNWNSQTETDRDGDGCEDFDEDLDDDGDGLLDTEDDCPVGDIGWTSAPYNDVDGDGCRDVSEDTDDDGDRVPDDGDSCPDGKHDWESNPIDDVDGDGCHDEEEDFDDDNDGFTDATDLCPGTPAGVAVFDGGCSYAQGDEDEDGVINELDNCPTAAAHADHDSNLDGCTDDIDDDGVLDDIDVCLGTPAGEQIDGRGCGYVTQQDPDGDGVVGANDICDDTSDEALRNQYPEFIFDAQFGCWTGDDDEDEDGYPNHADQCPESARFEIIFEGGCTLDQQDTDGDGVNNGADGCPGTSAGASADESGCSRQQLSGGEPEGSSAALIAIIAAVFILIIGGGVVAALVIRNKQSTQKTVRTAVRRGDMPAPATEVAAESLDDPDDFADDPNYETDENGCEWWRDDEGALWYRTPEMDDWAEYS